MNIQCNLCGSEEFKDLKHRVNAICARCGAYERTRVMKLFIDRMNIGSSSSVLHLAPERGLYETLRGRAGLYICGDIDMPRYSHIPEMIEVDLCNPETYVNLGSFDLIIHSHVIEHVPCNYTAVLINLHRMLKPNGIHMFAVPIYGEAYEEDLSPLSEVEKEQRFGQFDHCRRFSANDLGKTLGAIFETPKKYQLSDWFSQDALDRANIPDYARQGMSGHTVFSVRADQIKL